MDSNFFAVIRSFVALITFTGMPEYLLRSKEALVLPIKDIAISEATLPKVLPCASIIFILIISFVFFIPYEIGRVRLRFVVLFIIIYKIFNQFHNFTYFMRPRFRSGSYKFYNCHLSSV